MRQGNKPPAASSNAVDGKAASLMMTNCKATSLRAINDKAAIDSMKNDCIKAADINWQATRWKVAMQQETRRQFGLAAGGKRQRQVVRGKMASGNVSSSMWQVIRQIAQGGKK